MSCVKTSGTLLKVRWTDLPVSKKNLALVSVDPTPRPSQLVELDLVPAALPSSQEAVLQEKNLLKVVMPEQVPVLVALVALPCSPDLLTLVVGLHPELVEVVPPVLVADPREALPTCSARAAATENDSLSTLHFQLYNTLISLK